MLKIPGICFLTATLTKVFQEKELDMGEFLFLVARFGPNKKMLLGEPAFVQMP